MTDLTNNQFLAANAIGTVAALPSAIVASSTKFIALPPTSNLINIGILSSIAAAGQTEFYEQAKLAYDVTNKIAYPAAAIFNSFMAPMHIPAILINSGVNYVLNNMALPELTDLIHENTRPIKQVSQFPIINVVEIKDIKIEPKEEIQLIGSDETVDTNISIE